ncbi:HNH endonuclease signature motif containing protein [Pseudomonas sp. PDM13]|uniref:HNH endonuclease signature motif containing protein n=1 Tax=Pseudomonas sp. PDM13 TaxID=2769255 RepID=UPI0021E02A4E|nr:HNH endonuclease signature motif containing protein [Pseudomonas sp. PDM13]MCU9947096.1 HNH endonuclease [Pseudomonas sp. PDM13]
MSFYPVQSVRPVRRTNLPARNRYSSYKVELREDFYLRCGYCDTPDFFSGGRRGFHIDHFAPKSKFDQLKNTYANLVYCCPICNIGKSNDWPSNDPLVSVVDEVGYIDPCNSDYAEHLARRPDGVIVALTPLGSYIHRKLKLNLRRRQICWLLGRMEEQIKALNDIVDQKGRGEEDIQAFTDLVRQYFNYVGILRRE